MRIVMTAASIAIVVILALLYIDLLTRTIRILSGFAAVVALFGIVAVGIAGLIAPMVIGAVYAKGEAKRVLTRRFLVVTGVQGLVLFFSELVRRLVLHSAGSGLAGAILTPWHDAAAIVGFVVGCGALVLPRMIDARRRRSEPDAPAT